MKRFSFVIALVLAHGVALADNKTSLADFLSDDTQARKIEKENFERRMRQVREDAAVEAERDRLNRDRQLKLSEDRRPGFHPLPDLSKQPKWSEIESGAKYRALSESGQQEIKSRYFDELIVPHVIASGGDVETLRQQFMGDGLPWHKLAMRLVVDNWAYGAIGIAMLLVSIFRKRVAVVGGYVVENAFRIAALAGAMAFIALTIRALHGPIFLFFR